MGWERRRSRPPPKLSFVTGHWTSSNWGWCRSVPTCSIMSLPQRPRTKPQPHPRHSRARLHTVQRARLLSFQLHTVRQGLRLRLLLSPRPSCPPHRQPRPQQTVSLPLPPRGSLPLPWRPRSQWAPLPLTSPHAPPRRAPRRAPRRSRLGGPPPHPPLTTPVATTAPGRLEESVSWTQTAAATGFATRRCQPAGRQPTHTRRWWAAISARCPTRSAIQAPRQGRAKGPRAAKGSSARHAARGSCAATWSSGRRKQPQRRALPPSLPRVLPHKTRVPRRAPAWLRGRSPRKGAVAPARPTPRRARRGPTIAA
mmetsp:Transcript_9310/g.10530  ORF Transcript_9310/g.10530 Transcript_9310/m.10530 type:complete len:311 (+) Transcript_9310:417-1349(+)